jgi:hypothetical protein
LDEGWTPLHVACMSANKAMVKLLLAHKADVNARTKNGCTPLSLAQERILKRIIELLRADGAEESSATK